MKYLCVYLLLFFVIAFSECFQRNPIYYLDNGGDQTIRYRTDIKKDKTIESTILAMLNLSKRPNYIRNPSKKSTSRFLLNIYKMITNEENTRYITKRDVDNGFYSYSTMEEVHTSDTIMAFSVRNVRSLGNLKGKVFWIDTSKLKRVDQLLRAELRIYKLLGNMYSFTDNATGEFKILPDF